MLLVGLLGVASATDAAPQKCTREQAIKAETEASSLKTWHEVFRSYECYGQCDDGAIGEGYSHSVATLLASRWDQIEELVLLVNADPKFEGFVLRHVDETMTGEQGKAIKENVRFKCPTAANGVCEAINKRFVDLVH
jgi:hypothetical protein